MDHLGRLDDQECTCGDPECIICWPLGTDWPAEASKLRRDLDEALDAVEYVHSGQNARHARSLRIKLLIKHGRIKESI